VAADLGPERFFALVEGLAAFDGDGGDRWKYGEG
jgi:hypothetical protein